MIRHQVTALLSVLTVILVGAQVSTAQGLPPGFNEQIVFDGLDLPTVVQFAADGRVFVAEKSGLIKVFPSLTVPTPTIFADLRTQVHNYWDRGLLGMALHPNFPTTPYVYVLYAFNAAIGGTAPRWPTVDGVSDGCPTPPGPNTDGCVISGRLSRLTASGNAMTTETVLLEGWCQQFPSHSIGSVVFGADGALYISGGDGASFTFADYGQAGSPTNPCGDPPSSPQTPPTAEGGSLRSQSLERPPGEPSLLNGAILRVDPNTGAGLPDNPLAASSDANDRRIIAYGLRNPFRITTRPNTSEVWVGDVGWNDWEEINRIVDPRAGVPNFGWPCYEGDLAQPGYDAAGLNICESLYNRPGAVTPPTFRYNHAANIVPGESCTVGSSSVSGLAFYNGGTYPAAYNGALFFADFSRNCIWTMFNPPGGGAATPIASYGFNETSGTSSADLSGNNHPASLVGGVTHTSASVSGNAIQLDGTTGYVSIPGPGQSGADFTASVWVFLTRNTVFQTLMEALDPAGLGWELDLEVGGRLTVSTNGEPRLTTTAAVPLNTWTYVTVRRSGATWQVLLNGVVQPQTGTDGTIFTLGNCPVYIGVDAVNGCTGATYHAQDDFSGTQGFRNWYYLYGSGTPMTFDATAGWWRGNETWLIIFANGAHPGNGADAIRQWVAPQAGSVRITGNALDLNAGCGGGVSVSIAKNATVLWQQTLADGNTAGIGFDLTTTVVPGDGLNFSVNQGPDGNNSCDATGFAPTIVFAPAGSPPPPTLNSFLQGRVDEVRIYNRALSDSQVLTDMSTPVTSTVPSSSGPATVQPFVAPAAGPVYLGTGPGGDLFYSDFNGGTIRRITYGVNRPPVAVIQATPLSGPPPLTVVFDGTGSSDPDAGDTITYAWDLDGNGQFNDSTATRPSFTYTTSGVYQAQLKVTDNHGATGTASVVVTVGTPNTPPTAVIDTPVATTTWGVGSLISFSGHATDAEDGALPASALNWAIILHHCPSNCHTHPVTTFIGVASGSFNGPDHDYPSYLELQLTVTDSRGATDVKSVLIYPQTVGLTFQSAPSGLQLAVGSSSSPAPFTRTVIIGSANSVSAVSPQPLGGSTYQFTSWSDGGAQSHNLTAPATPTTYTATYQSTTTTTSTLFPSSVTVLTGTLSSGTVSALTSDDNVYLAVNSTTNGTRTAAWYGSFTNVPRTLTTLNVNYTGNNSRNCTQTVVIWQWTTSAWTQLDSRTVGTTEVAINNLAPTGTLTDYVSGTGSSGEVRVRIQCQATANLTSRGDVMSLVYTAGPSPSSITTYHAQDDFSNTQGYRNWYYLYGSGTPMTFDATAGWWRGNETYLLLWGNGAHPGSGADAIRQWVAPQAGSVRITGNALDLNTGCGGGVSVSIAKNATVLWQQTLANGNTAGVGFDLTTTVLPGDGVNFSVNQGPDGNNYCDATGFDPTIVFTPS